MIYENLKEINFEPKGLEALPARKRVLFTSPDYYDVQYSINPHMEANIGKVDREEAWIQWTKLRKTYTEIGLEQHIIPGAHNMPDMVFCANQSLPFLGKDGQHGVYLSRMNSKYRAKEVTHFGNFFMNKNYSLELLPQDFEGSFEGMGDAQWHPTRRLLFGGYGFRTNIEVYHHISDDLKIPIIALKLVDPDFYHLDTCLCMLTEDKVLYNPTAFDEEGIEMIKAMFSEAIEAQDDESRKLFACNAHCPDGENVIIQKGCAKTVALLEKNGFTIHEVETGEFLKAGGSVYCMKMMFW